VEMEWGFNGRTDRIDSFTMVLEAIEKVTYRVGTDTRTDENVFYREPLVAENQGLSPESRFLSFKLPSASMHSFSASNNEIEWVIKVKADVKRWADIEDEFPLIVRPEGAAST